VSKSDHSPAAAKSHLDGPVEQLAEAAGFRSASMSRLEDARRVAWDSARRLVEKKFKEPASLEDIREMRAEYRRKLNATESQLSSAVRSRLDGVKRARDLIQESSEKIEELHAQFGEMEQLSRDCRGLFGKYPHIKTLHHARRNLAVTAHLVEYFYTIPSKAAALLELLQAQPDQVKYVCSEATQLEGWRISFMAALKDYGDSSRTRATFQRSRKGADPVKYHRIVERVGPQLSAVLELSDAVREQIRRNIIGHFNAQGQWVGGGCQALALNNPALLVRTLEAHEILKGRAGRIYETTRSRALKSGGGADEADVAVAGLDSAEALQEKLVGGLRDGLRAKITSQFAQMQMAAVDAGDSKVHATLTAATNLIVELENVDEYVAPCFPPSYEIVKLFGEVYEEFIQDLLLPLVGTADRMSDYDVKDILEALKWLQYYITTVAHNDQFARAVEALKEAYLGRIKDQILKWVRNLKGQELEPMQTSDDQWVTTFPDDMFNLINIQIGVAKTLPEAFLGSVLLACLEVLEDIQADSIKWLEANWASVADKENGLEQLCAAVNDNLRLQEKSDEFIDGMAEALSPGERRKLEGKMDEVSGGYVNVSMLATAKISQTIVRTMESILADFYSPEWEDGTFQGSLDVIETYKDFFGDLVIWLPDFFFAKLVRFCLDDVFTALVLSLLREKSSKLSFAAPIIAAQVATQDTKQLLEFFKTFELTEEVNLGEMLQQAGLRDAGAVDAQAQMLRDLIMLLEADSMDRLQMSTAQAAVKRVVMEFQSQGVDVVMHILSLQRRWAGEEQAERLAFIERLAGTVKNRSGRSQRYKLKWGAGDPGSEAGSRESMRESAWNKVKGRSLRELRGAS
jgi:exocyst complex component 3